MRGERETDENGIEFGGPLGFWMRTRNRHVANVIVLFLLFGWLGYMQWSQAQGDDKAHDRLAVNQDKLNESLQELIYVNALTPEERAKLHITMPDSLRKKLRGIDKDGG